MAKARTLVGLDVHAAKIVAVVLDPETGEVSVFRLGGDVGEAAALCAGLPGPVRAAGEAGPTGYGLARELARRGMRCVVAAPGKIPRACGDRVKTDRRDAEHLVRLLLAGRLHPVRVPGPEEEALRDLVRAREAVRQDLMRCRRRLSKLLLRRGIRFDDGPAWSERHRAWLATIELASRPRRRRWPTRAARSRRSCIAATSSSARSSRCCPPRHGPRRSGGCAACAGSTRSPRPGSAPRSATSNASRAPGS